MPFTRPELRVSSIFGSSRPCSHRIENTNGIFPAYSMKSLRQIHHVHQDNINAWLEYFGFKYPNLETLGIGSGHVDYDAITETTVRWEAVIEHCLYLNRISFFEFFLNIKFYKMHLQRITMLKKAQSLFTWPSHVTDKSASQTSKDAD